MVHASTGDAFVPALIWGIAVGRIGCFLSGLADHTSGIPTDLPWGVDFGDEVLRHPTALYETIWVVFAGAVILSGTRAAPPPGIAFRRFFAAYFAWRFAVEWIKPSPKLYAELSAIQRASLLGIAFAWGSTYRLRKGIP